jgi:outer membrane autotransporter protein
MTDPRSIAVPAAIRTRAIPNLRRGALLAMASALSLTVAIQDARADGGAGGIFTGVGGAGGVDNPTGTGGVGGTGDSNGGGGGGGGAGTTGGAGGAGVNPNTGAGGAGGTHGYVGDLLPDSAAVGTDGQVGAGASFEAGGGGAGGFGAVVTGSGALGTLSVNVSGGNGGDGGNSASYEGGSGGSGGVGLWINATDGVSLTIAGQVQGGAGGAAGSGNIFTGIATAGAGGAGIVGQNLSVTIASTGSVVGGSGADAIRFTGGTNVLTLESGAAVTGAIAVTGSLEFAQASDATLSNVITGTGDISKTGAGTLTLGGVNSYSGGTTVDAGILALSGAGSIATSTGVTVNAGATFDISGTTSNAVIQALSGAGTVSLGSKALTVDQASNTTFSGVITGTGSLTKSGAGTLTLTGASALDWTIEAGALVTSTQLFTGNAAVASGATLTFNQAENGHYDGQISGAGVLSIDGGARVELTGNNSAFTGEIQVLSGRLVATGTVGGTARIDAGGILAGNGSVGSTIISAGGTVSPGNSIGTVTINGNLVFEQGSSYEVEVDPTGSASDLIVVTGTATLNGGTVAHIGFAGNYRPSASYTILTAAGGVTGQFAAVSSDFAFLTPTLGYSANAVTLTLTRNDTDFAEVAASFNQRAVAGAAEGLGFGNAIYDALVVTDAATAQAAFDSLSGEIHASLRSAMIEDAGFVRAAALDRLRSAGTEPGVRYWLRGLGARGRIDGDGNAGRMTHDTAGVLMGADAVAGETVQLGIFGGWQKGDIDVSRVASSADVDSWSLGFYAGGQLGQLSLRAGGALSSYNGTVTRRIAFADFDERAKADVGGSVLQAFGEIGYPIDLGDTHIEPVAGIAHVALESETTREQGGAAALYVASGTTATTFTTLGARLGQSLGLGSAQVVLDAAAGWRHAFGERRPDARVAFAGNAAQTFTIGGAPIAKDMLSAELGLGIALSANARLDLRYAGDVAGSASSHGGNATFALRF